MSPCDHSSSRSPRFVPESSKQHRKSRALVLVSAINSRFTANLFDKRSNDPHSQSFAGDGIETFRQGWTIIGNRQRVVLSPEVSLSAGDKRLYLV
jgi:hypothetical protein